MPNVYYTTIGRGSSTLAALGGFGPPHPGMCGSVGPFPTLRAARSLRSSSISGDFEGFSGRSAPVNARSKIIR